MERSTSADTRPDAEIGPRMSAAAAVRFSAEADLAVLDGFPAMVRRTDLDGRCGYCNLAWLTFTGRTWQQEQGTGWTESIHPEDRDRCFATLCSALEARAPFEIEYRLRHRGGGYRTVIDVVRPVLGPGDAFAGFLGACYDWTEHRRTEVALRESELKYSKLFDASSDAIVLCDPDGTIVEANRRAEVMWGGGSLRDRSLWSVLPGPAADAVRETLAGTEEGRAGEPETANLGDHVWVCSDEEYLVEVRTARFPVGETRLLQCTLRDVSEQRRLERQLFMSQRMEAVGSLAGGVAHDFNNVLAVIGMACELVLEQLPSGSPSVDPIVEINEAVKRGADLTRQLLAFGRRTEMWPRSIDVNHVISDLGKMLGRVIGEHIAFELDLDPDLAPVKADPGQLEQVLMNLVVNAKDAMTAGGWLRIETNNVGPGAEALWARYPFMRPGRYVQLSVSDTGSGMDEETQRRVFEPFFSTKHPGAGTGLGLSTVYGIVKQSEGFIFVESVPGRGTTFRVFLPATDEAPDLPRPEPVRVAHPRGSETILVVEDEQAIRRLIRRILVRHGYSVLEAADGFEALDVVATSPHSIDLIVSDVVMPRMGSDELAARLPKMAGHLRVLLMSGHRGDAPTAKTHDEGALFLSKPFTSELLLRKVREALASDPVGASSLA